MAFSRYEVIIIYNDGFQSKFTTGASSSEEAYAKGKATANCSASSHKGVDEILVHPI